MIKEVTGEEFKEEMGKGLVLADFFSLTCGPCKMLNFVLRDVLKEVGEDFPILKLDYEQNLDLAEQYDVTGHPTLVLFKDGTEVARLQGLQQKPVVIKMIQKFQS